MLESLRNVAENMVAVLNNSLKCFSNMQDLLVHGQKGKVRSPSAWAEGKGEVS